MKDEGFTRAYSTEQKNWKTDYEIKCFCQYFLNLSLSSLTASCISRIKMRIMLSSIEYALRDETDWVRCIEGPRTRDDTDYSFCMWRV